MRTAVVLFVVAMLAFAAHAQRQDEALDSLMLSESLQPVNDPIPRLLAEALASSGTPGSYGSPSPAPTPSTAAPISTAAPPTPKSGSSTAAAGVVSLLAAAAAAAALL